MHERHFLKKIFWIELTGLLLIVSFLWMDELFDLPHYLFGASPTPVNIPESLFETIIILVLGGGGLFFSLWQATALQKSIHEKDRLINIISHDLRSPFANLIGNSELLKDSSPELSRKDQQELATGLHSAALKTYALLDNLLSWAQLQKENSQPRPCVINLEELVNNAIENLSEQAADKQVEVHNRIAAGTVAFADDTEVLSVVQNLLSNALKYSFPQGEVLVSARQVGDFQQIDIVDHGQGIDKQNQQLLLGETFSSSTPGTSGEQGSGIGLMLVKEFVARNGGNFEIQSSPGQGSTFSFTLPAMTN